MKRTVLGIILALTLATPVLAAPAKASITAHPGPFEFGVTYHRDDLLASWSPARKAADGHWTRLECSQGGTVVGAGYLNITGNTQTQITLGPSPSWSSGDAECDLTLVSFTNGVRRDLAVSNTFAVIDQ